MWYRTSVGIAVPFQVWFQGGGVWKHHFAQLTVYGIEVGMCLLVVCIHREKIGKVQVAEPALILRVVKTNMEIHDSKVSICGSTYYT